MKTFAIGFLFILFISLYFVDCQRWNANGKPSNGKKTSRVKCFYSEESNGGKSVEVNGSLKSQAVKQSSRGGIGAWGYISLILFVIFSGLGVYYTILFYPIVCKKQRMYHVMGSTTV